MTHEEADTLEYFLGTQKNVNAVKVYQRIGDAAISYEGDREEIITLLKGYVRENVVLPVGLIENSGRALNEKYKERLVLHVLFRYMSKLFIPKPLSMHHRLFLEEQTQAVL